LARWDPESVDEVAPEDFSSNRSASTTEVRPVWLSPGSSKKSVSALASRTAAQVILWLKFAALRSDPIRPVIAVQVTTPVPPSWYSGTDKDQAFGSAGWQAVRPLTVSQVARVSRSRS
jgi:hypothetical protein